jgi:hypothetical protein
MPACKGEGFPKTSKIKMAKAIRTVARGHEERKAIIKADLKLKEMDVGNSVVHGVDLGPGEKGVFATRAIQRTYGRSPFPVATDVKFLLYNDDRDPCLCLGGWEEGKHPRETTEWVGCYSRDSFLPGPERWNEYIRQLEFVDRELVDKTLEEIFEKYGTRDGLELKERASPVDTVVVKAALRARVRWEERIQEEILPYLKNPNPLDDDEFKVP